MLGDAGILKAHGVHTHPQWFLHHVTVLTKQVALVVKNPLASAGDVRDAGSIPGWGRSPGEGNGNPLQHSCLENATDRGA